jgi:hypothetical protein
MRLLRQALPVWIPGPALLVLTIVLIASLPPWSRAQAPPGDVTFTRLSTFRIPFQTEPNERRIKQIQLYVSTDQGRTWDYYVSVAPDRNGFDFRAQRDGAYWFAVRTIDLDGHSFPLNMEGARPGLKVVVDTQPPIIRLQGMSPRDGEVGVQWEVRDDNLDPAGLRLDYRLPGSAEWQALRADVPVTGQHYWRPETNGSVEVRLRARDRAENWSEEKVTVSPNGYVGRPASSGSEAPSARPSETEIRLVNSTKIALNYEIQGKGKSGVGKVELWVTRDSTCRAWSRFGEYDGERSPLVVDVPGEGLYGFTILPKSGVGIGDPPPQSGDRPQIWLEVDQTKPVVRIGKAELERDNGRLTINWTASDKNLGANPIDLYYTDQLDNPNSWKLIESKLSNTGHYVWQMPSEVPFRFWVRVVATDRAGNVGSDEGHDPIIVDLSKPKGFILGVEGMSK